MSSQESPSFASVYTPIRKLGEGAFGTVLLAQDTRDGTLHAAKIIPDERCNRKTFCQNRGVWIPDEILISEVLEHPHIVELEEIYFEEGKWILVMEFLPGFVDLFDFIAQTGPMSVEDARNVTLQLVDAVNYLTSLGVDHRDIKDENILYNPSTKQIKLIDFGSASMIPDTPYTKLQGTEVYVPPEYHRHGVYSSLVGTTWAIGCLVYVLLNGDCPFNTNQEVKEFTFLRFGNRSLDQQSRGFLQDLLTEDEQERMLPGEIIFHPWMNVMTNEF